MEFILASASPRRKALLQRLINGFRVVVSDADETVEAGQAPHEFAVKTAEKKAVDVSARNPDAVVIGADTIVVCGGEIMGKPADDADAFRMLEKLSGKTHEVVTGLCVRCNGKSFLTYETTKVEFDNMTKDEILTYIKTGEPADKAGAYGIQGAAGVFIKKIEGCYFNVVGLPLNALRRLLGQAGINVIYGGIV